MIVYRDLPSLVITVDRHVYTGRLNSLSTPITNEKQHLWFLLKSGIVDGFWQQWRIGQWTSWVHGNFPITARFRAIVQVVFGVCRR